jgi:hypothetical protein
MVDVNTGSQGLEIFNLILNLVMFLIVGSAAIITLLEMKVHFNLGNKLSYLLVTLSLCMRISLSIYEYSTKQYGRTSWKFYVRWFIGFSFMIFYFNCFYKVIASWEVSNDLKKRSDAIKSLDIKEQFKLLYDTESQEKI